MPTFNFQIHNHRHIQDSMVNQIKWLTSTAITTVTPINALLRKRGSDKGLL